MGEMLGKLYVKEFFNEKTKKRYEVLVEAIRGALKTRIEKLTWMSDSTKQKAFAKLAAIKRRWAILTNGKTSVVWKLEKKVMRKI
jgi:putative endopeptidase